MFLDTIWHLVIPKVYIFFYQGQKSQDGFIWKEKLLWVVQITSKEMETVEKM